jgi:nitrate reductase alpha subunit
MMGFIFGGEADNHAVNTVPKECLISVSKAEDGGLLARGPWKPGTNGTSPDAENAAMKKYLAGEYIGSGSAAQGFE